MPQDPPSRAAGRAACPECGRPNQCGAEQGDGTCWCFALPHVLPLADTASSACFCPDCARARIARRAGGPATAPTGET